MPACLHACVPVCACPPARLPCLPASARACLRLPAACPPSCLLACSPICQPACSPACLPARLQAWLPGFLCLVLSLSNYIFVRAPMTACVHFLKSVNPYQKIYSGFEKNGTTDPASPAKTSPKVEVTFKKCTPSASCFEKHNAVPFSCISQLYRSHLDLPFGTIQYIYIYIYIRRPLRGHQAEKRFV